MDFRRWRKWILVASLVLGILVGQTWATYRFFTSKSPGGNDFFARWANGCALIWSGEDPYSDEVTLRTQIGMHGRPARPGEDLAAYSYPLYTLFFFWPLCYVHPYPLAHAAWMTLMMYALLGGIILTAKVIRWDPPSWLWGLTLIWGVLNYPHARALILGQMATLVYLAMMASLWVLERRYDVLAGALLAITTIKPQMSFLLIPWMLWWAAWRRRWGIWKGFTLAMALLVGVSLLLVPTWLGGFVDDIRSYDVISGTDYRSLTWIVVRHLLGWGRVAEGLGVAAFSLVALWAAWRGRQDDWKGFLWTTGLLIVLTNFVAPRTATTHYTMLLLPLFVWFRRLQLRQGRWAGLTASTVELGLMVGQWAIFLTTLRGNYETAPVYLPFPVLMLVVHLMTRQRTQEHCSPGV